MQGREGRLGTRRVAGFCCISVVSYPTECVFDGDSAPPCSVQNGARMRLSPMSQRKTRAAIYSYHRIDIASI